MMRLAALAFLSGILICHLQPTLPHPLWLFACLSLLLLAGLWRPTRWLWFLAAGVVWMLWHGQLILAQQLPFMLEGQSIHVIGRIANLPQQKNYTQTKGYHWQFNFQLEQVQNTKIEVTFPHKIRLNWYEPPPTLNLQPGQQWAFMVKLKRPHTNLNPHTRDYTATLFAQGIRAIGYIQTRHHQPQLLTTKLNQLSFTHWQMQLNRFRYQLALRLERLLRGYASQGTLIALAIGERQWLNQVDFQILNNSGTAHLIAISGLHIGIVALFGFYAGRWLWCRSTHAMLWLPAPRFAAFLAIIFALVYALLAGLSIPTQRALIMVIMLMLGHLFGIYIRVTHRLALALFLVLIIQPLSIVSAGFWLSFSAVAVLAYALSQRRVTVEQSRWHAWVQSLWYTQGVILFGLAPITLYWFGQISLLGFIANMLALPLITFAIVPLVLLGTISFWLLPTLGAFILLYAATFTDFILYALQWLQVTWQNHYLPDWAYLSALFGMLILLSPLPKHHFSTHLLIVIYSLPLFFYLPPRPAPDHVKLTLLDVGQGLATVVQTHRHTLVYDTGARFRTGFNLGAAVVVPFLRGEGVQHIDTLLISHRDTDHVGGALSVLEAFPNTPILTSAPDYFTAFEHVKSCLAGQVWQWDGVTFEILHPQADCVGSRNDCSCVLRVMTGEQRILLSGDIGTDIEKQLVDNYIYDELNATILVAPHHGSKYASSPEFIRAVKPQYVIFSTNYRNQWGFPRWETRLRYRYHAKGVVMLSTPDTGAIQFILTPQVTQPPQQTRQQLRRYWH